MDEDIGSKWTGISELGVDVRDCSMVRSGLREKLESVQVDVEMLEAVLMF